ncbi:MAG: ATP-binding protein [candidate division KSB1 bacterium]|nr:ATP-binding protein [candidate division KSB1 bacterium]MDZ7314210.1 ATP-binding protein [candidate division KSB1 bacterium]
MVSSSGKNYHMVLASKPDAIETIERLAAEAADWAGLDQEEQDSLAISVTEIANNAIVHGNKRNPRKKIFVNIEVANGEVRLTIRDQGTGFDPNKLSNPLDPENLLRESGRGVFIVRSLMDEVLYDFSKGGTEVTIIKRRKNNPKQG